MRKLKQIFIVLVIIVFSLGQQIKIPLIKDHIIEDIYYQIQRKGVIIQSPGNSYFSYQNMIMGYSGYIEVGLNKKTYRVIFDTGSEQLWLASSECVDRNECEGLQNSYTCLKSDGCTQTEIPYQISYMKGYVEGNFTTVQLSFQGQNSVKQNILLVNKTQDFKYLKADGVFGLGYKDLINLLLNGGDSYITTLKNNTTINEEMFSFYLGFKDYDSELTIGGFNSDKLQDPSQIYYHKVIESNGFYSMKQRWSLEIKSFSISGFKYNFPKSGNISVVDSGSSLIILPINLFYYLKYVIRSKYGALSNSNEMMTFTCSQQIDLPDLKFSLEDHEGVIREYSIPSSFYIVKMDKICVVMVQSMKEDVKDVAVILGNVFMRRYVSIFTHTNSTVGLSLSIANPSDGETYYKQILLGIALLIGIACFLLYWKQSKESSKESSKKSSKKENSQSSNVFTIQGGSIRGCNSNQNQAYFRGMGIRIGGS